MLYTELNNLINRMYGDLDAGVPEKFFTVNYAGNEVKVPLDPDTMDAVTDFVEAVQKSLRWDLAERLSEFIGKCHGDGSSWYKVKGAEFSPGEIDKHLHHGDGMAAAIWMWLNMTSAHGPEELEEEAAVLQYEMMEFMDDM